MDERALVEAASGGDQAAFGAIYDAHADAVHDLCCSVMGDSELALDAVHATFVAAARMLDRFGEPERLRLWLLALARDEALRRVGPGTAPLEGGRHALLARVTPRQRVLLDLHRRRRLGAADVGVVTGVGTGEAATRVADARRSAEAASEAASQAGSAVPTGVLAADPPVPVPAHLRAQVLVDSALPDPPPPGRQYDEAGWPPSMFGRSGRGIGLLAGAGLALVAILLGAILLLDGGDDAGDDRATRVTSTSAPASTAEGSTDTSADRPTSTTAADTTTSATGGPPAAAPELGSGSGALSFGSSTAAFHVPVANEGTAPLRWEVATTAGWLLVSPDAGTVAPGRETSFTVTVDRSQLPEGPFRSTVQLLTNGGSRSFPAVGSVERPPELSDAFASRDEIMARGCGSPDRTAVTVTATDESGIASVVVSTSAGSQALAHRGGGTYTGTLGPFDAPGTLTFRLEVADARGNVARSTAGTVRVVGC